MLMLIMAGIWGSVYISGLMLPGLGLSLLLAACLLLISWYDFDHYRIPNFLSLPLIAAGLVWAFFQPDAPLSEHLSGAAMGYGLIWAIHVSWLKFRQIEAIGMGDAKLLAAAGAWLGLLSLPFVLLVASISALLLILCQALIFRSGISMQDKLAFGPFLVLGFWTVWLLQDVLRISLNV